MLFKKFFYCTLIASLKLSIIPAVAADGLQAQTLQVVREGDTEKTCHALSREAALMRDIIFATQGIQNVSTMQERGISVAGAAAAFLVGTVTGGIGLAAAGMLANSAATNKADEAETVQDKARQRRSLMTGIYYANGCQGPIEHVMQEPDIISDPLEELASIEPAAGNAAQNGDTATTEGKRFND